MAGGTEVESLKKGKQGSKVVIRFRVMEFLGLKDKWQIERILHDAVRRVEF